MSGIGGDALPDDSECREAQSYLPEWTGGLPVGPGVVGKPFVMSVSGRDALPDVREWSAGPPGCQGVVGRSTRKCGSSREDLPDVQEWS